MKSHRLTREQETAAFRRLALCTDPTARRTLAEDIFGEYEWVPRMAIARLKGHLMYEDLLQEGRFAVWRAIERFDPLSGTLFKTFAGRRAYGAAQDFLRAKGATIRVPRGAAWREAASLGQMQEDDSGRWKRTEPAAEHDFWDDGFKLATHIALSKLPAEFRRVMVGIYFNGETLSAIATELGRTESNVSKIKSKALARLQIPSLREFASQS